MQSKFHLVYNLLSGKEKKSEERRQNNQLLFEHRGRERASKQPALTGSPLKMGFKSVTDFQIILVSTESESE